MKKVAGAVVGLYLVGLVAVSLTGHVFERAAIERYRRAVELGEQQAPLPAAAQAPLAEACKGKLTAGGPHVIAAYVAKMANVPSLPKDYYHVDRTLLAATDSWVQLDISDRFVPSGTFSDASLGDAFKQMLNPADWSRHLGYMRRGSPQMEEVKYLIAARYASLTMPEVGPDGYDLGAGEYGARVLSFPEGQVLCEGRGTVRMKERVTASGHGKAEADSNARDLVPFVFTQAVTRSPLADLCEVGGDQLCKITGWSAGARR